MTPLIPRLWRLNISIFAQLRLWHLAVLRCIGINGKDKPQVSYLTVKTELYYWHVLWCLFAWLLNMKIARPPSILEDVKCTVHTAGFLQKRGVEKTTYYHPNGARVEAVLRVLSVLGLGSCRILILSRGLFRIRLWPLGHAHMNSGFYKT